MVLPGRTIRSARSRTMLRIGFVLSLLLLVNSDDCDPQKQNQRISSLESEVKQLKDKVAELEQKQASAIVTCQDTFIPGNPPAILKWPSETSSSTSPCPARREEETLWARPLGYPVDDSGRLRGPRSPGDDNREDRQGLSIPRGAALSLRFSHWTVSLSADAGSERASM
jgi:hypothetical protein